MRQDIRLSHTDWSPELSGAASEAVQPGDLLERGGSDDFQLHATAGGGVPVVLVALARPELGEDRDDTIPSGDEVKVIAARPGDHVLMRLASGQNVAAGAELESAGDGTLQASGTAAATGDEDFVVGEALEAVDATGGEAFIPVEIHR